MSIWSRSPTSNLCTVHQKLSGALWTRLAEVMPLFHMKYLLQECQMSEMREQGNLFQRSFPICVEMLVPQWKKLMPIARIMINLLLLLLWTLCQKTNVFRYVVSFPENSQLTLTIDHFGNEKSLLLIHPFSLFSYFGIGASFSQMKELMTVSSQ